MPRGACAAIARRAGSRGVAGHRAGVAEAEVDVLVAVDVGEARALGLGREDREAAGPAHHPVHRHAAEQRVLRLLAERVGARVLGAEALELAGHQVVERHRCSLAGMPVTIAPGATSRVTTAPETVRRMQRAGLGPTLLPPGCASTWSTRYVCDSLRISCCSVILFQTPQLPPVAEIAAYYARSEEARWFSNRGPCHELLIERLEGYLGPGVSCVPVGNATAGLMLGLRALVGPRPQRREVLLPSFTFAAAVSAVLWTGLEPVFVDVEERSWHLDPPALRAALARRGDRVGAVLAASTFGAPPAMAQRAAWEHAARAAACRCWSTRRRGSGRRRRTGGRSGARATPRCSPSTPRSRSRSGRAACSRRPGRRSRSGRHGLRTSASRTASCPTRPGSTRSSRSGRRRPPSPSSTASTTCWPAAGRPPRRSSRRWRPWLHGASAAGAAAWQFVPVLAPSPRVRAAALALAREREIELRAYFSVPLHRMPAYASAPVAGGLRRTEDLAARALSLPMANDQSAADRDAIVSCWPPRRAGPPTVRPRSGRDSCPCPRPR